MSKLLSFSKIASSRRCHPYDVDGEVLRSRNGRVSGATLGAGFEEAAGGPL